MKVGVYLIDTPPSEGGGFSYMENLIQAIDNYAFNSELEVCFAGRIPKKNITIKKSYVQLAPFFVYKFFRALERLGVISFFQKLYLDIDFCCKSDIRKLKRNNIDIILYPKQAYRAVNNFPFISMNWDIGYKSSFPFPELTLDGNFDDREKWYAREIQKAFAVFLESESGKREFLKHIPFVEDRAYVVPIFPGRVINLAVSNEEQENLLSKLKVSKGNFFFYPAQFWSHKNHYNLVLAFQSLLKRYSEKNLKLIFTGSDKGNKNYIRSVVKDCGLQDHVEILGFVSNEEIYSLYKNSIALVMPSMLGPTNMPLMEAMSIGTAVICTDFEGHREICSDAALYVDPANSYAIMEAMESLLDEQTRESLLLKSEKRIKETPFKIDNNIVMLEKALLRLKPVRKTFE